MDIEKTVERLINKHDTSDPFKLADELGIAVVFEPLGSIHGYYSKSNRIKVLHINESLTYEKQLITCAHELGHAILHPNENTAFLKSNTYFPTSRIELEANQFMLALLFNQGCEVVTLNEATEQYGISEQLLFKKIYT